MAASFPNTRKTFSSVVNGVTKLVASLFNSPYDEISAIEDFIGPTGGGTQAFSESMTNLLLHYWYGCSTDYKSTSDFYVRAGELMIADASGNRRLRRNTADTTVTSANIDTGGLASSTQYYVYALADSSATTFTIKFSTSASAPSGATFYRLIGTVKTDGSSQFVSAISLLLTGFGLPVAKSINTNYQALTDGIVQGYTSASSNTTNCVFSCFTDTTTTPSTLVQYFQSLWVSGAPGQQFSFSFPVKKGDYYKVTSAAGLAALQFVPLGP